MPAPSPPSAPPPEALLRRAAAIKLVAMDVDGVLTDGSIAYTSAGEEIKTFNAKDGQGLVMLRRAGLLLAIVTARESVITQRRAQELEIPFVFQRAKPKRPVVAALLESEGLSWSQVAYIGDDLPDLPVLAAVGLAVCPSDAVSEVQARCHWVAPHPGGRGAVRALADVILAAQGVDPVVLVCGVEERPIQG